MPGNAKSEVNSLAAWLKDNQERLGDKGRHNLEVGLKSTLKWFDGSFMDDNYKNKMPSNMAFAGSSAEYVDAMRTMRFLTLNFFTGMVDSPPPVLYRVLHHAKAVSLGDLIVLKPNKSIQSFSSSKNIRDNISNRISTDKDILVSVRTESLGGILWSCKDLGSYKRAATSALSKSGEFEEYILKMLVKVFKINEDFKSEQEWLVYAPKPVNAQVIKVYTTK